jgi:hypothetical protein
MYGISHSWTEGPQTGLALQHFEEVLTLSMICGSFKCFMDKRLGWQASSAFDGGSCLCLYLQ